MRLGVACASWLLFADDQGLIIPDIFDINIWPKLIKVYDKLGIKVM